MSGGFVFIPRDGQTVAACGLICADDSDSAARTDQMRCGESVIALNYMALGLTLPTEMVDGSARRTLQEMMHAGDMPAAVGGFAQFTVHVA